MKKKDNGSLSTPFTVDTGVYRDALLNMKGLLKTYSRQSLRLWNRHSPLSLSFSKFVEFEKKILDTFSFERALKNLTVFSIVVLFTNPLFFGPFFQGNVLKILFIDSTFLVASIAALVSMYMFVHREYSAYQNKLFHERRLKYIAKKRASLRDKPVRHLHKLDENKEREELARST